MMADVWLRLLYGERRTGGSVTRSKSEGGKAQDLYAFGIFEMRCGAGSHAPAYFGVMHDPSSQTHAEALHCYSNLRPTIAREFAYLQPTRVGEYCGVLVWISLITRHGSRGGHHGVLHIAAYFPRLFEIVGFESFSFSRGS